MAPSAFAWIAALVLALLFGSFLNVCISRLPRHLSIVRPGSHCPRCGAAVRPWDNVPVLSWLLLRGRCRDCREPISPRYPLVEAGFAGLVAAALAQFGFTVEGAAGAVFCFFTLGLLVTDLETMLLPDALTLPGIGVGLAWAAVQAGLNVDPSVAGALSGHARFDVAGIAAGQRAVCACAWALLMLAIRWGYYAVRRRHGLGAGDVKLVAMLAAWLGGLSVAVAFFLAVIAAALVGIVLGIAGSWRHVHRSVQEREAHEHPGWRMVRLPLGAFLCAGGMYALFFAPQTLAWYLSFWP